MGLSDEIRNRVPRRRGRWTYGALEEPAPAPTDAPVPDPAPKTPIEPAKPDGQTTQSRPVVTSDPSETEPDSEVAVATTTTTPEFDRAVPRGLQVAAAWSWRVLLVVALIALLGWLARYLSEVIVPVAVAILLAALLSPVANRLRGWGLHRAAATAATVLGGLALIAGALILIGTQIACLLYTSPSPRDRS